MKAEAEVRLPGKSASSSTSENNHEEEYSLEASSSEPGASVPVQTEGAWWVLQVSRVTSAGAALPTEVWAAPSILPPHPDPSFVEEGSRKLIHPILHFLGFYKTKD